MAVAQFVNERSFPTVERIITPPIRKTMTNSNNVSCAPGRRLKTRTVNRRKKYPRMA
jgi:hypothetical protein